jgi:hypothetical protein
MPIAKRRSIAQLIAAGVLEKIIRTYRTRFNGASYVQLGNTVTINGDFELGMTGTFNGSIGYIVATKTSENGRLVFSNSSIYTNNAVVCTLQSDSLALLTNGAHHELVIIRTNGVVTVKIDGVDANIIAGSVSTSALIFDTLFSRWGGTTTAPYFTGYAYNFYVKQNGVKVIDFKLDEPYNIYAPVAYDAKATLGVELWKWNGTVTAGTQWGLLDIGGVRCNDSTNPMEVGSTYLVCTEYSGSGGIQLRIGGAQIGISNGVNRAMVVTAANTGLSAVEASASNTAVGAVVKVSIKKVSSIGTYINRTVDDVLIVETRV